VGHRAFLIHIPPSEAHRALVHILAGGLACHELDAFEFVFGELMGVAGENRNHAVFLDKSEQLFPLVQRQIVIVFRLVGILAKVLCRSKSSTMLDLIFFRR